MAPPASPPLTGHAARAVISTERRVQIWDQFIISFKETVPPYQWCTREELVAAACSGDTGIKFTVEELTEVIRGRKHKREAGVDSQKVDGEWLYRFVPPGSTIKAIAASKLPAPSKLPPISPPSKAAKLKPKLKSTTPRRTTPLRPRAKSPSKVTPPPEKVSGSRKRNIPSSSGGPTTAHVRSSSKKLRPSPQPKGGGDTVEHKNSSEGMGGGLFRFVGGGGGEGREEGEEGGRWGCAVM